MARTVASYPAILLDALMHAQAHGQLLVPTAQPAALRLQVHGLIGALRKEGREDLAADVGCYITEGKDALLICRKDHTELGQDLVAALDAAKGIKTEDKANALFDTLTRENSDE